MRLPFVSRARYDAARAEADRQRERAEKALNSARTAATNREQIGRQLAEENATNRRLNGRLLELGRRLSKTGEADPEYAASLERKVAEAEATIKDLAGRLAASEERARTADRRAATEARPVDGAAAVSPEVVRLRAELRRSNQARAALDADRADLVRINNQLNRQVRDLTERSRP